MGRRRRLILVILGHLGAALGAREAEAANRRSFFFGGEAAQSAAALIARARGTDALLYNPAGLAGPMRNQVDLSMTAINLRLQTIGPGLSVAFPDGTRAEDLLATELQPVPSALVFGRRLSDAVGLGYGIYVTESTDSRFDTRVARDGFDVDGVGLVDTRTGVTGQALEKTYLIGGGLGMSLTSSVRLGFALFAFYNRDVSNVQVFSSVRPRGDLGSEFLLITESADVKTVGLAPRVSVQWSVSPALDVGFIARPPVLSVYAWGDRAPLVSGSSPTGEQSFQAERQPVNAWTVEPLTPASFEAMVAGSFGAETVGATVEVVVPIESRGALPIDTRGQWNLRIGGRHRFSDTVSAGMGFHTDRAVERPQDADLTQRIDYYGATAGVTVQRSFGPGDAPTISTTLAFGYAAGVGRVDGIVIDPLGSLADIDRSAVDVVFHELTWSFATGLAF